MDDTYRAASERRMADLFAKTLPEDQLELWNSCKFSGRFFFTCRDGFAVDRMTPSGRVSRLDIFVPTDVGVSFDEGFSFGLINRSGERLKVTPVPSLLPGYPIFVWVPPYSMDIRMVQDNASRTGHTMTLNMAYRCLHSPKYEAVTDKVYLTKTR